MYFAVVTATTVGYGDMKPVSPEAQAVVTLGILLAFTWLTVGFAAILAYLKPKFDEIAEQQRLQEIIDWASVSLVRRASRELERLERPEEDGW